MLYYYSIIRILPGFQHISNQFMNTIHVCILTTAHPIDDKRVNYKFAHAFRAAGFRVSWIGPGHSSVNLSSYASHGIDFLLAPPIRRRFDRLFARHRIIPILKQLSNVDVFYTPDPDSAELAIKIASGTGAKVIFDIHEIFHGALLHRWLLGYRCRALSEYVRRRISRISSQCDLVIGVSNTVLNSYLQQGTRSMVVRSCAPSWFSAGEPADVCGKERMQFVIMHGLCSLGRGTMQVLEAAAECLCKRRGLRIIMFRSFSGKVSPQDEQLISRIQQLNLTEVIDLRPRIHLHEMPAILKGCDTGLIAYGRELGVDCLPNRVFEYMAAGLPIVAPVYATEIAEIISSEQCGIMADFENPVDIARAIDTLRQDPALCRQMGQRAREAFLKRHNWEVEVQPVIDQIKTWYS